MFYNDIIDLKKFDARLLKIEKKSHKNIGIYNIGYITIKKIDDCEKIYSVNPLYLFISHANGYIEEKSGNKHLVFDSTDEIINNNNNNNNNKRVTELMQ